MAGTNTADCQQPGFFDIDAASIYYCVQIHIGGTVVLGYIRVSTEAQDTKNQRFGILDYANRHGMWVDEFLEFEILSRKDSRKRGIGGLLERL